MYRALFPVFPRYPYPYRRIFQQLLNRDRAWSLHRLRACPCPMVSCAAYNFTGAIPFYDRMTASCRMTGRRFSGNAAGCPPVQGFGDNLRIRRRPAVSVRVRREAASPLIPDLNIDIRRADSSNLMTPTSRRRHGFAVSVAEGLADRRRGLGCRRSGPGTGGPHIAGDTFSPPMVQFQYGRQAFRTYCGHTAMERERYDRSIFAPRAFRRCSGSGASGPAFSLYGVRIRYYPV